MKRSILFCLLAIALAAAETPQELYQKALLKERSEGKLDEAIQLYRRAAETAGKDRTLAANALLQLAAGYEKLGNAESRRVYERVLREYADQKEASALARVRLGRDAPAMREGGIVTRQVWPDAIDNEGAPSPDGRYLSYVDWTTGDLAVRDLTMAKGRHLTNKGTWQESEEFALFSVFSPDGKQIAYSWFNGDRDHTWDLRIVSVEDAGVAKPRVLYHGDNLELPFDWSKDGKQILAMVDRNDQTHQIALISTADGSARILKTLDWRAPSKLSLSPDGRYIAYDFPPKEDSPQRDIFVLAADGSRESALAAHPANDRAPVWTPDGTRIVFTSDRSGSMGAWIVTVADGKAQGSPELLKADVGRMAPMGFTHKSALFYSLQIGDSAVYTAKLDLASGRMQEPEKITDPYSGLNMSPDWSPDGRFLAFVSRRNFAREPGSAVVCIRAAGTGEQRELRPELSYFQSVRWSPDGKSLLIWGADRKGRKGIFQVDAVTGMVLPVVATGDDVRGPVWSPDGQSLYYYDARDGRVVARDRKTGLEKELVPSGRLQVGGLTLSPDGRQLAMLVAHRENKTMGIDVIPAAGGEPREIVSQAGTRVLSWMPDSRYIIFARDQSGNEWWRIPAGGGEAVKIAQGMPPLRNLSIHPDAQRVAFNAGNSKAEIWVMENFLPALSAKR